MTALITGASSGIGLDLAQLMAPGLDLIITARNQAELERIVRQIRKQWPKVEIIVRADAGFCREELLKWCEANSVSYVIGMARNERLRRTIEPKSGSS